LLGSEHAFLITRDTCFLWGPNQGYIASLFVAGGLENWKLRSCRRIVVEERESRAWDYKGVQRSATERTVSRRVRTRMERVLDRRS
jgi:hypothetical protein